MKTDGFKYLVDLSSLLDVRLGAVSVLDSEYAKEMIFGDWTKRKNDAVLKTAKTFTYDDLSALLKKGDLEVLKTSLPTLMTNYLFASIREAHAESVIGDSINTHHIVVNVHPYSLSVEEQNVLKDIVLEKVPNVDDVSIINIPMHFITPGYLRGNEITHFINYDLVGWLNLLVEVLMNDPIPSINMICPKLLTLAVEDTEDPELTKTLLKELSPFSAMELQFMMYIALRFIDVSYFSVVLPEKPA